MSSLACDPAHTRGPIDSRLRSASRTASAAPTSPLTFDRHPPASRRVPLRVAHVALSLALGGCVPHAERVSAERFVEIARARDDAPEPTLDGSFEAYVAVASRRSPSLEASFERWRAASSRVRGRRRWPRPQISYAALVRPVETRVGPQRQRVGARIPIAWPGQLRAGAEGASAMADAEGERFASELVRLRARIADAYWPIWAIERRRAALDEEIALLGGVAESLRARIEVGRATVAQAQLVELRRARAADARASLDTARRRLEAALRAVVGLDASVALPIAPEDPELRELPVSASTLAEWAAARPDVRVHEALARASGANEREIAARRLPDLALGVEWMETGPARMPNVRGDGDDAWMIGVTVGVPVDLGALADERRAATADVAAHHADARAVALAAQAELEGALAELDDARRRVHLHEHELRPSAEAAWEATVGAFASGGAALADVLLAARELVELHASHDEAKASFARAWARVESAVGRGLVDEDPNEHANDANDANDANEASAEVVR